MSGKLKAIFLLLPWLVLSSSAVCEGLQWSGSDSGPYNSSSGPDVVPGVVADWLFEETEDPIVDAVGGVTLSEDVGAITYSQTITGDYESFGPCVQYGSVSGQHEKLSGSSSLDIGTEDFSIEWLVEKSSFSFPDYNFSYNGNGSVNDWAIMVFSGASSTAMTVYVKADDGTGVSNGFTLDAWVSTPTLFQLYCDRSASCELFQDEVSKGTFSITSLSGKTITNTGFKMGGQYNTGSESFNGKFCRWRMSVGEYALTNSLLD